MNRRTLALAAAAVAAFGGCDAFAAEVTGAGSTFAYPLLAGWADVYRKDTGDRVNYQPIGSGAGIQRIEADTVSFAATDQPLTPDALAQNDLAQFPLAMGAVVPVVNLPGVKAGDLVIDGATLAAIYLGRIKTWDDPALKKLNPGLALPHLAITTAEQSGGSGTTFNFTDYLSKVSPDWKAQIGENVSVDWPVGVAVVGNEGVSNFVRRTKGAIGYVEYVYAERDKLAFMRMIDKDGEATAPTIESFQAAAANADWARSPGFYRTLADEPGPRSWPIAAATFALMRTDPKDKAAAAATLAFFSWALTQGQKQAQDLNYVPMPPRVVALIKSVSWIRIALH